MLFVERSNRTENLVQALANRLVAAGRDPLAPSFIVVQGPGMERWVAQFLARHAGVCANVEFLFPRDLLDRAFDALPEAFRLDSNGRWSAPSLVWEIARTLDELRDDPDFTPLTPHLDADDGGWRRVQLSRELAGLIDRYVTFRPDWIDAWSRDRPGPEDRQHAWQAKLVRTLGEALGPGHLADRTRRFVDAVAKGPRPEIEAALGRAFPDRIEIFAVSTLPTLTLTALEALGQVRDLHLSVLSPSRVYWADLWREVRDADASGVENEGGVADSSALFGLPSAMPTARLLAGLGRLGADFQRILEDHPTIVEGERDLYRSPLEEAGAAPSLLSRLQARILDLEDEEPQGALFGGSADRRVREDDDSLRVHFCHGPRRELEVVEAVLRDAFEADTTLSPEDVIVMAPRIDEIVPEIEAVFDVPSEGRPQIPHRVADRGAFGRSRVADAFRSLLVLLGGRFTRTEMLEWLARKPVHMRFGLDEKDVEAVAEWAPRAGIRFGLDGDHREALGLSSASSHTWSGGLDRLTLAHAFGATGAVAGDSMPIALGPFDDPAILGALGDVESLLLDARRRIGRPRSILEWSQLFREFLDRALARDDSNEHEHVAIRQTLATLAESAEGAGFRGAISFEAAREAVVEALTANPAPQAFLAGGVTFCELVPLRAIPFRVVVIVGLADEVFPRGRPAKGFDLMARHPRPGDRTLRDDDRHLFLEALLSAREKLVLTVPARDLRDGQDRPPSIVVTELLDAIDQEFIGPDPSRPLRDRLVISHALQATSPRNFSVDPEDRERNGVVLRDRDAFLGAEARVEAMRAGDSASRRFLAPPGDGTRSRLEGVEPILDLEVGDLIQRITRSTRSFARGRLGMRLPQTEEAVDDLDPYDISPLSQYALGNALLTDLLDGMDRDLATRRLEAHPDRPSGIVGRLALRSIVEEASTILSIARERGVDSGTHEREVELEWSRANAQTLRLVGRIDGVGPAGRLQVGYGRIESRSEAEAWIKHLVLCAEAKGGSGPQSILVGRPVKKSERDRVVVFGPVEAAEARSQLLAIVDWATSVENAPLPLFPKSSRTFAGLARKGGSENIERAWRDAQQEFLGGDGHRTTPESRQEREIERVWEGRSPIVGAGNAITGLAFDDLAMGFFGPLLDAREAFPR